MSPIPSFSRWLNKRLDEGGDTELLTVSERRALGLQPSGHGDADSLKALLHDPSWQANPELSKALKTPLLRLCATYLLNSKRDNMFASDSVYCPRVLGQWFDGIRFYAAASSPRRSRRTWAGLR